ncbi:hypothetical protein VQL36_13455 [Chengkuizengella sp. SCS-71B]|uniref:hypothetical protein n=1 Tax=Chengkuizengella sp. SCS-71B TaxID=3115290 RepID=UPI0032C23370
MKKKLIFLFIGLAIVGFFLFLQKNWELMQYKYGFIKPLIYYKEDPRPRAELLTIQLKEHNLKDINIKLTDLYYSPDTNRLHFGFWYNKWSFNNDSIDLGVFHFNLVDDQGKTYSKNNNFSVEGVYEIFEYIGIDDIDLYGIDTLRMYIHPLDFKSGTINILDSIKEIKIYDKNEDKL